MTPTYSVRHTVNNACIQPQEGSFVFCFLGFFFPKKALLAKLCTLRYGSDKPFEEGTGASPSSPSHSSTQQNGPWLSTVCSNRYKSPELLLISRFLSHPRPENYNVHEHSQALRWPTPDPLLAQDLSNSQTHFIDHV